MVGRTLGGRYTLTRQLGRGGMATVFAAADAATRRPVAIKLMRGVAGQSSQVARFEREIAAIARLDHPNIVSVYGSGIEGEAYYYAMEYVDGWSLATVLRQLRSDLTSPATVADLLDTLPQSEPSDPSTGISEAETAPLADAPAREPPMQTTPAAHPPPRNNSADFSPPDARIRQRPFLREMVRIALDAARALAHACERGVIHRDVKPDNILLDVRGKVLVTDFGLASVAGEQNVTVAGELLGTPRYMSPEQIGAGRVPIDARTDVYSLGTTLYEMLTLTPPHHGRTREALLQAIAVREPRPIRTANPGVDRSLAAIVERALAKDPEQRYATMAAFAADLERWLAGRRVQARRVGPVSRFWRRRSRATQVGLMTLAFVTAAAAWLGVQSLTSPGAPTLSSARRATLHETARVAGLRGDWSAVLTMYARLLPTEPRSNVDLRMRHALARLAPVARRFAFFGPEPRIALDPASERLAIRRELNAARVVDLTDPNAPPIELMHDRNDFIQTITFSQDGRRIVTFGMRELRCWTTDGGLLAAFAGARGEILQRIWLDRAGARMLVRARPEDDATSVTDVYPLILDARRRVFAVKKGFAQARDADLSSDGAFAAGLSDRGAVTVRNLNEDASVQRRLPPPPSDTPLARVWCVAEPPSVVTLDDAGVWRRFLLTDATAQWGQFEEAAETQTIAGANLDDAAFVSAGPLRWAGVLPVRDADGAVRYRLLTWEPEHLSLTQPPVLCAGVALFRDRPLCATWDERQVHVRSLADARRVASFPITGSQTDAADRAHRDLGAVASPELVVVGEPVVSLGGAPLRLLVSNHPAGAEFARHTLWDVEHAALLAEWSSSPNDATWRSLSPGGEHLYRTTGDGFLEVRDLRPVVANAARLDWLPQNATLRSASIDASRETLHALFKKPAAEFFAESVRVESVFAPAVESQSDIAQPRLLSAALQDLSAVAIAPDGQRAAALDAAGVLTSLDIATGERHERSDVPALSVFAFVPAREDLKREWPDGWAVGGTADGGIVLIPNDAAERAPQRIHTPLGRIRTIAQHASALVAIDEQHRGVWLDLQSLLPDLTANAGRVAVDSALTFDLPSHDPDDPNATNGAQPAAPPAIQHAALLDTGSANVHILATATTGRVDLWLLAPPTFAQPTCLVTPLCAPVRPSTASAPEAADVLALAFDGDPATALYLLAVTADGIAWRHPVLLAGPAPGTGEGVSDAWRRRAALLTGRRWSEDGSQLEPVPPREWSQLKQIDDAANSNAAKDTREESDDQRPVDTGN